MSVSDNVDKCPWRVGDVLIPDKRRIANGRLSADFRCIVTKITPYDGIYVKPISGTQGFPAYYTESRSYSDSQWSKDVFMTAALKVKRDAKP